MFDIHVLVCCNFNAYCNKIAFQSKVDHPETGHTAHLLLLCLDLDPVTLIYELDLDITYMWK